MDFRDWYSWHIKYPAHLVLVAEVGYYNTVFYSAYRDDAELLHHVAGYSLYKSSGEYRCAGSNCGKIKSLLHINDISYLVVHLNGEIEEWHSENRDPVKRVFYGDKIVLDYGGDLMKVYLVASGLEDPKRFADIPYVRAWNRISEEPRADEVLEDGTIVISANSTLGYVLRYAKEGQMEEIVSYIGRTSETFTVTIKESIREW